jgi:hypothetical protein
VPDALDDLLAEVPTATRGKTGPRLPDLIKFAQEFNLPVGSTTGGRHNVGSRHYSGNAIDIKGSGRYDDARVQALKAAAAERGFLVRDERRKPPRQKVWGGPHIHIEATDAGPVTQADPLDQLLVDVPAVQPQPKAPPKAKPADGWRPKSIQGQSKLFETPKPRGAFAGVKGGARGETPSMLSQNILTRRASPENLIERVAEKVEPRKSSLGTATTVLPGVHQILRLLPEEDRENIVEGVASAIAGTVDQLAGAQELGMKITPLGIAGREITKRVTGFDTKRIPETLRRGADFVEGEIAENVERRPEPTTFAGDIRRGVGRGVGGAAVELPKLIGGGTVLKGATLPVAGALSSTEEGVPGIIKGAGMGLVYHYGGGITGKVLGKVGNSLVWIGGPTAERMVMDPDAKLGETLGENIPIGLFAGTTGARKRGRTQTEPVRVIEKGVERPATEADLPKIVKKEIEVAPPTKEVIQPSIKTPIKEVSNETTAPLSEGPGAKVNSVRQAAGTAGAAPDKPITTPAAPSITSARKEMFKANRAELDLPELPLPERKSWQKTLSEAKAKGTENAGVLADEVLAKPRALDDVETGQMVLRAQEIKNAHSQVMKEIGDTTDPNVIQSKRAQADALQGEFDRITEAVKKSGTEKGRALASQKLTINQDFDLVSVLRRAKASKGRELNEKERAKFEEMTKRVAELEGKLQKVEVDALTKTIQKDIERLRRQSKRSETRQAIDEEFADLRTQFAQARIEAKSVQASGLAGIDPEGKLTPIILKMARNRVKAGVVEAERVIDDVYSAVKEHVADVTKDDIRRLLATQSLEADEAPRKPQGPRTPKPDREASNLKAQTEGLKRKIQSEIQGRQAWWETVLLMRKAGLLTGPKTHARNVGSTGAFQGFEEMARLPGGLADLAVSTVTKQRALGMPNLKEVAQSSYTAATKGVRDAVQVLKYGATADDLAKMEINRESNSGSKIIDTYLNTVFRTLGAEDKIFRTYAYERSIREQKRLLKTEQVTPDMEAQGILDAEVSTFNNRNVVAEKIEQLRGASGPVGSTAIDLIIPFKRTPANVASRLLESTPLGLGKAGVQLIRAAINKEMSFAEQRKFSQTLGRSVTGSGLMFLGWKLAELGLATGLYEKDAGDREVMKAKGASPLSIRVGDTWHQIGAFSPLGNLIAIGAALHREHVRPPKEGEEKGSMLAASVPVGAKVLMEQPFLKGTAGVVEALQEPRRRGEGLVASTVGSFIPTAVADAGRAIDNKRRRGRSVTQKIQERIPVVRNRVQEDFDVFGRPIESRRTGAFDPTLTASAKDEAFIQELVRLDVGVVKTTKRPGESDEQLRVRQIAQGQELERRLARLVATRGYQSLPDDEKVEALKDEIERVRKEVNARTNRPESRRKRGGRAMRPTRPVRGISVDTQQ